MKLNCIWWWGSSSGDFESVEYSFIAITSMSTLNQNGNTCYGPIFKSNRCLKIILIRRDCVQKNNLNNYTKKLNMNVQWTRFSNLLASNGCRWVNLVLKSMNQSMWILIRTQTFCAQNNITNYYSGFSDYYIHYVSADMSSGHLQMFLVEHGSLHGTSNHVLYLIHERWLLWFR